MGDIRVNNFVVNGGGNPIMLQGLFSARPTPGFVGRVYIATDALVIYRDTGTTWDIIGFGNSGNFVTKWQTWENVLTVDGRFDPSGNPQTFKLNVLGDGSKYAKLLVVCDSTNASDAIATTNIRQINFDTTTVLSVIGPRLFFQNFRKNAGGSPVKNIPNDEIGAVIMQGRNSSGQTTTTGGMSNFTVDGNKTFLAFGARALNIAAFSNLTELMALHDTGNLVVSATPRVDNGNKLQVVGNTESTAFIKTGGTATQSLQADGTTLDLLRFYTNSVAVANTANCAVLTGVNSFATLLGNVINLTVNFNLTPTLAGTLTRFNHNLLIIPSVGTLQNYLLQGVAVDSVTGAVYNVTSANFLNTVNYIGQFTPVTNNLHRISLNFSYSYQ